MAHTGILEQSYGTLLTDNEIVEIKLIFSIWGTKKIFILKKLKQD